MCKMRYVVLLLYLLATICRTTALIDGLYCGNENCYDGRLILLNQNLSSVRVYLCKNRYLSYVIWELLTPMLLVRVDYRLSHILLLKCRWSRPK